MTDLELWLTRATRQLSVDSAGQVRREIQEHYESARESAISKGSTAAQADGIALTSLGDAAEANCQYRQVLLTSAEARLLREGNWEARAVCAVPWARWAILGVTCAALSASAWLFLNGSTGLARGIFAVGLTMSLLAAAPRLPIYTPARSKIFRAAKWILLAGMLTLAFGAGGLKMSWLLVACSWPVVWTELRRTSIRRKLPVAKWPKHLYF